MTTLKTFQSEIDEIHNRELSKQRAQALIKERERENKHPHSSKGKAKDVASPDVVTSYGDKGRASMLEVEEKIMVILAIFSYCLLDIYAVDFQTQLLSQNPADLTMARDSIAALLTQHYGEYVFRIGQQPSHADLFSGDLNDESSGWTGTSRTVEQIDALREAVSSTVEEVGGKVFNTSLRSTAYSHFTSHRCYLRIGLATADHRCFFGSLRQMFP